MNPVCETSAAIVTGAAYGIGKASAGRQIVDSMDEIRRQISKGWEGN